MQNWVSPKVKPLAFAIHLGMAALITTAVTPVAAQSPSSAQSYSIAAGQLDDVLKQFCLVAGINVYSNAALLKDIPSSGQIGRAHV